MLTPTAQEAARAAVMGIVSPAPCSRTVASSSCAAGGVSGPPAAGRWGVGGGGGGRRRRRAAGARRGWGLRDGEEDDGDNGQRVGVEHLPRRPRISPPPPRPPNPSPPVGLLPTYEAVGGNVHFALAVCPGMAGAAAT